MAEPKTASERFFRLYDRDPVKRLKRDLWVLRYMAKLLLLWFVVGGRLRRAKARAARDGRVLHVDTIAHEGARPRSRRP
jgi:hypothetical protein